MTDHADIGFDTQELPDGKLLLTIRNGATLFADKVDPASARSRAGLLKAVREKIPAVDVDELEREILQHVREYQQGPAAPDDPGAKGDAELAKMPTSVRAEADRMLRDPDLLARLMLDLRAVGIVGEHALALTLYLLGTSRLLPKPLAGLVQGSSSSGKSHVVERIASLFPPEAVLLSTDMTANALYYLPSGSLRHRFVCSGERSRAEDDERAEATRALREMISSGVLRKVLPQKNGDRIETVVIESPGPIAFVETTTLTEVFEEDRNRMLLLASDDSEAQTRSVIRAIAESYAGSSRQTEDVVARHHAAQRMLRRLLVQIPFAPVLAAAMPVDRPEARRAIHQALTAVQAVALLHQFQRLDDPKHGDVLQANLGDYRVARKLLIGPLGRALGGDLPDHVVHFAEWLSGALKETEAFTVPSLLARPGCRWSRTTMYDLVKVLHGTGVLAEAGMEGRSARHRLLGQLPAAGSSWLPTAEALEEMVR